MGLYNTYILPKVIDWACKQKPNKRQREKVVPLAFGNVLEIGIGSGLNLPFYDTGKVKHLLGIDTSQEIWDIHRSDTKTLNFSFDFIKASAENIPEDNDTFDSVVITYTLCSISDLSKTFEEIRRVLKPGGTLIFCEHGKAPDANIAKWQNRLDPVWSRLGGGCHLNREIPKIISENGFKLDILNEMYIPGWKPASYNYWGTGKQI
ncbi:class I SAM-dependent methyltransferase [Gaetbulibacter sp. M240]|uniref:class I SAM-dependent methyltransferase n=1 Tax=Gaetbulibacter sp. M240 TaxID=3126511 RepID=UPI00374F9941